MTPALCLLAAIALVLTIVAASREISGVSPLTVSQGLYGLSALLLAVAIATPGIWFYSDFYLADVWTVQDALHKTAAGLQSSTDYFNPIGPMLQWVYGLTLRVEAPSTASLVTANTFVAGLAFGLTILLLRRRASALTVAIVGLIAVTTALSARDIDTLLNASQSSFLAPYNRWGWALLAPLVMRAALDPRTPEPVTSALSGLAIALLLLLKVTYGAAAIGCFAVAFLLRPVRYREIGIVLTAMLCSLLAMEFASRGQVGAYLHDLAVSARMPANGLRLAKLLTELPAFIAFGLGSLLLTSRAIGRDPRSATDGHGEKVRAFVMACAVGASGIVVLMQNHYASEAVTLILMPLVVAERERLFDGIDSRFGLVRTDRAPWIGAIMLVVLAVPTVDAGSILTQAVQTHRKMYVADRWGGTEFANLAVDETYQPLDGVPCTSRTCNDVRRVATGADLIRAHCPGYQAGAVLAFNFANPFPTLLGSPSPRHAPIWFDPGRSFSPLDHVAAAKLFDGVQCVIIAKNDTVGASLSEIYGSDLRKWYSQIAEDDDWSLWTRTSSEM